MLFFNCNSILSRTGYLSKLFLSTSFSSIVTEEDQNLKQLSNLKYLTEKWNDQPIFFRGAFTTIYENLKRAVVDPLNLAGGLIYGQVAKKAGQKAFQKILQKQIKKQFKNKKGTMGQGALAAEKAANAP